MVEMEMAVMVVLILIFSQRFTGEWGVPWLAYTGKGSGQLVRWRNTGRK